MRRAASRPWSRGDRMARTATPTTRNHSIWYFPQRGYVVVSQDCRARFDSEGDNYDPLFQEGQDGYDTVEWAARQPWCNGRVATTGQSYLGATQYTLAAGPRPPHLACMAPVSASADFHQSWVYHTGGAMEWGWMVPYAIHKGRNTLVRAGREDLLAQMDEYVLPPDNFAQPLTDAWFRHLPLRDWIDRLKETAPYFHEYFGEEKDGPYWSRINLMRHADKISLPMFHVSSWYDIFLEGALNGYQSLRDRAATAEARRSQRLLVGPWAHIRPYTAPTSGDTGDIDFGPEARIELHEHLLSWFDYWLKDIESGLMDEPPVSIFVMGENRWRAEQDWPLARTHYVKWYIHSRGLGQHPERRRHAVHLPAGRGALRRIHLRPRRPGTHAGRLHPHHPPGRRRPAGSGGPRGRAGIHLRPIGTRHGAYRSHHRHPVRRQHCDRYGLHRQAGGCAARRLCPQPAGRHHPRPLPHPQ